ncbi:hypothetical protein BRADI_2g33925v3 [Brachypodium distachyon]|uniref:Uncharacterized protein n=1 Tax=Brachypodium distachyon TaxID=15368 RepID=A0A2K2DBP2_BRADI|nr:hypothetical protein BRADI_2g33925v3 [Brachypodium distachyon]
MSTVASGYVCLKKQKDPNHLRCYVMLMVTNEYRFLDRYIGHIEAGGQETRLGRLKMQRTEAQWSCLVFMDSWHWSVLSKVG